MVYEVILKKLKLEKAVIIHLEL